MPSPWIRFADVQRPKITGSRRNAHRGSAKSGRERVVRLDSGTLEVLRAHRRRVYAHGVRQHAAGVADVFASAVR